eukprot:3855722-Pyramimonas_sp.AAC.1
MAALELVSGRLIQCAFVRLEAPWPHYSCLGLPWEVGSCPLLIWPALVVLDMIGGAILRSNLEYTCTPANSEHRPSHLDSVICSEAAKPDIRSMGAIADVPWKPHV